MIKSVTRLLRQVLHTDELVTRKNDPNFFVALDVLPNPDPILGKMGKDQSVYNRIVYDAHVMGDLRSLRSGLLGFESQFVAGGDDPASQRAYQFILEHFSHRPTLETRWDDLHWNIYKAVLTGQSIHEIGWKREGDYLVPAFIKDRPSQRFRYSLDNELRYLTRKSPMIGEDALDKRFLITRHMPSHENPYGIAVLSACFWPYTFKHAGWQWFAKFAEKYGIPWAIGRYPEGSHETVQTELANRLAMMVEDAIAAVPEGTSIELLSPSSGSGDPIQERLINLANREMSKALTSQTLATEIQGNGSRAATQTHSERQEKIAKADREMVSETINQLLRWITELNFAGAKPPYHEFYKEDEAREKWAKTLDISRKYLPISRNFAYERLQITPPQAHEDLLSQSDLGAANFQQTDTAHHFSGASDVAAHSPLSDQVESILALLEQSQSLEDFQAQLEGLGFEDEAFAEYMAQALQYHQAAGMAAELSHD